ncbi:MAG: hypothetical protein SPI23_08460, partial [Desulfovibrio sp.]|uniref:hypothetical protein n=1 Tax=Desulfovibrio sp. TaxID=885 RepID=UPI002A913418
SKDLRWTEIRISKFLPVRYSLVNEPHRFTRREAVVYAASFSLSTSFFIFAKVFFRGPVGATRWREGDLCLIFKPASRTFLPSGKISFSVVLSDVAGSLARMALCAFSTPPSSIFPQKILRICSLLTDYSINIPKKHRKFLIIFFAFFLFASLLFPPIEPLSSPLRPESAPISFRSTGFLQTLKTVPQPWIFCSPLFDSDTKQKGEPEGSPLMHIYGNA